mgnify:CR=1 FL=1
MFTAMGSGTPSTAGVVPAALRVGSTPASVVFARLRAAGPVTRDRLADHPENPYLWELKGQILFEFNRITLAEEPQRKSVQLKPDAPLLRINLGQTLISLNDPKKVEEGVQELKRSLLNDPDNAVTWRLLAQAYDKQKKDGEARLATAEQYFSLGAVREARVFAMRARELLKKDSVEWRRATDIVLTSNPSNQDLKDLAKEGAVTSGLRR